MQLPDFSGTRLLIAGDVMLDRYWSGATQRISPEAPVPIVRVGAAEARPGGAANVALNAVSLGARVSLLGVIGRDEPGQVLQDHLPATGIDAHWEISDRCPTITKLRVMSRHQQVLRLDFEESLAAVGAFDHGAFRQRYSDLLADADVVLLSDYAKGTLVDTPALIAAARALGKPVLVDPKGSDFSRYHGATLLTPNVPEMEAVVGSVASDEELVTKGEKLMRELALEALLVTRSEKGMSLLRQGQAPFHLPTQAREVFDVTGAGDTVIATLAVAVAACETLEAAVTMANLAAGIVVGKLGTAAVSRVELARALGGTLPGGGVYTDEAALSVWRAQAREQGHRVVMTNGCFDVLHVGHVRYLRQARALGDRLIVAVNDDASVSALKGPSRPLNRLADRMEMLAALDCVDAVIPFSEQTPARLIGEVLPDILVKGGDYRPEQIAGGDAVRAAGGEVRVLGFHEGYSTTSMIERAQRKP